MLADAIRQTYGYHKWATDRILDTAAHLTPEQWLAPQNIGRGSIRDTLVHMISAQRGWLAWWDGSLPPDQAQRLAIDPAAHPDVASVRTPWEMVCRSTQAFLDRLTDVDAERVYSFPIPKGMAFSLQLWQMMLHVANHGTQHRSEVAAMLTGFGHSPGDLDMLNYFQPARPSQAN